MSPPASAVNKLASLAEFARSPTKGIRLGTLLVYLVFMGWHWNHYGLPFERLQIIAWMLGAMAIATIGSTKQGLRTMIRDWLPMAAFLAIYDLSRGIADTLGMPIQRQSVISIERALFGSPIPSIRWQERFLDIDAPPQWWELATSICYFSHFIVSFALLAVLWVGKYEHFRMFRRRFGLLTLIGVTGYILLPTAPPWMSARDGLIDEVARPGVRGFRLVGWSLADVHLRYGSEFINRVAAMPSLHGGWSMLIAIWLTRYVPNWAKPLLFAYPAFMVFTLVIGGEHYIIDVLAGFACAFVAVGLANRYESSSWAMGIVSRIDQSVDK